MHNDMYKRSDNNFHSRPVTLTATDGRRLRCGSIRQAAQAMGTSYHKAYYALRTGRRVSGWGCKYDSTGKEGGKAWQQ